jgi:hypothetical protein
MYKLSSSLYDRIRLEETARARAQEYLRNADVPVWQIDPNELADRVIALEDLPIADDLAKAKACYTDQCRRVHAQMLRDAIRAHRGDDVKHVRPVQLLLISPELLEDLGDIADNFTDGYRGDADPDGDLLLSPTSCFNRAALAVAQDAGAKVVHGYKFAYPRSVADDNSLPRGWCGYRTAGEGYALQRDVAEVVWAASVMQKIRENNGDLEYTILHCRCI